MNIRAASPLALALALTACSSDSSPEPADVGADTADTQTDTEAVDAPQDLSPDVPVAPATCAELGFPVAERITDGPFGARRHEVADDFTLPLHDGTTWSFAESFSGCDAYAFVPDTIALSDLDPRSIWEDGVDELLDRSPPNARYFFVSRQSGAAATDALDAMQARIDASLAARDDGDHWASRVHVVAEPASALGNWVGDAVAGGVGQLGLTIDRGQRVRAVGSLADVTRYDAQLAAQEAWPWANNIAYVANEIRYYNYEAERDAALDAVDATEVTLWQGEVIEQFADMTVTLPSAEQMAAFDTAELVFTQRCPEENALEAGNCGAWDYLAHFWLQQGTEEDPQRLELARHITTYHREGSWVVDITPSLVALAEGGEQTFRWEWAPEWNVQPTATWLTLRFSNQDRGERPVAVTELWGGRAFDSTYNDERTRASVDIPATASRVELRAIVTGHGADTNQCAEFCNHQHEFIVGNRSHYIEFNDTIDDDDACMDRVDEGVVPNQWGTWWLGRGGWCPGQQVDPWIIDVTDEATPGEPLSVDYFGWYGGRTPPDAAGNIQLRSFIVVYE